MMLPSNPWPDGSFMFPPTWIHHSGTILGILRLRRPQPAIRSMTLSRLRTICSKRCVACKPTRYLLPRPRPWATRSLPPAPPEEHVWTLGATSLRLCRDRAPTTKTARTARSAKAHRATHVRHANTPTRLSGIWSWLVIRCCSTSM